VKNEQSLDQWVHQELDRTRYEGRRKRLEKLLADLHKHQSSMSLPVGSPQRLVAEQNERKVLQQAMSMGYQPPEQQIKDLGLHIGLELGLGL